jgi:hypothetical protein
MLRRGTSDWQPADASVSTERSPGNGRVGNVSAYGDMLVVLTQADMLTLLTYVDIDVLPPYAYREHFSAHGSRCPRPSPPYAMSPRRFVAAA